jgi:adenosylcobinamide-phosphate guanylyltransferase
MDYSLVTRNISDTHDMNALLMCGGRGTRLDSDAEKPRHEIGGRPMLDRVRDALARAETADTVHLVTSPHAPETAAHVADTVRDHEHHIEAAGDGYVADLGAALRDARVETPVLTVVADLPLLAADAVDAVCDHYAALPPKPTSTPSLTVCVPVALKKALGVSVDTSRAHGSRQLAPTGVNVVGQVASGGDEGDESGGERESTGTGSDRAGETDTASAYDERLYVTHDARLAVNVNRRADVAVAERLADDSANDSGEER